MRLYLEKLMIKLIGALFRDAPLGTSGTQNEKLRTNWSAPLSADRPICSGEVSHARQKSSV